MAEDSFYYITLKKKIEKIFIAGDIFSNHLTFEKMRTFLKWQPGPTCFVSSVHFMSCTQWQTRIAALLLYLCGSATPTTGTI